MVNPQKVIDYVPKEYKKRIFVIPVFAAKSSSMELIALIMVLSSSMYDLSTLYESDFSILNEYILYSSFSLFFNCISF